MPVCWAGNVSLNYPPKSLILDVGTNLAEKPSLNSQNTVEATGWSASKLGVGGILKDLWQTPIGNPPNTLTLYHWYWSNINVKKRPTTVGIFTGDQTSPQLFWSMPCFIENYHAEAPPGHADYYFDYQLTLREAYPVTYVSTATPISTSVQTYSFPMPNIGTGNGYIAGVVLVGQVQTSGNTPLTAAWYGLANGGGPPIGSMQAIGQNGNYLYGPVTNSFYSAFGISPPCCLPCQDVSGNVSILQTGVTSATTFSVKFNVAWNPSFMPTNIQLIWVPA